MARKLYVTRTIKSTRASILCMDIEQAEPMNITVILPAQFKDAKAVLKAAKPMVETDVIKAVSVADYQTEFAMYRMPMEQFIVTAEKVDVK